MSDTLLKIRSLSKVYHVKEKAFYKKRDLHALTDIDLDIRKGETLGLVGESGCGKSTLGRCILRLEEPDSGSVLYAGEDILALDDEAMRRKRKEMQIIFQDPASSLNPYMKVRDLIGEGYKIHGIFTEKADITKNVKELMAKCGLKEGMLHRKPHEFSGGQRQRISIARALAVKPDFIVCDEPVSALDVSVQAQIINLLVDLQREFGLTYLFISHDLMLVEQVSDRIAVMYLGRIMERKSADKINEEPMHPYTRALLASVLDVDSGAIKDAAKEDAVLEGDIPSPIDPPKGCVFHTRCFMKKERCVAEVPKLREIGKEHYAACHFI